MNKMKFLIDVGVGSYTRKTFSPDRYTIWTMQSQFHNLPTVNGVMQAPGRQYQARSVKWTADAERAVFELDLAGAYPPEAGLETWQRRVILKRREAVIIDEHYKARRKPRALFLTLMTPCRVRLQNSLIQLLPRTLPGGDMSGRASVRFDSLQFRVFVERIPLSDSKMQSVWGDHLTRIRLHLSKPTHEGQFALRIERYRG